MVHRPPDAGRVRHDWPLRLGSSGTDEVVESAPDRVLPLRRVPVLHRLGTAAEHAPAGARRPRVVRAAGVPARRDGPLQARVPADARWCPSELVADCFELAWDIRELDMRASPYDFSDLGFEPVRIETAVRQAGVRRRPARLRRARRSPAPAADRRVRRAARRGPEPSQPGIGPRTVPYQSAGSVSRTWLVTNQRWPSGSASTAWSTPQGRSAASPGASRRRQPRPHAVDVVDEHLREARRSRTDRPGARAAARTRPVRARCAGPPVREGGPQDLPEAERLDQPGGCGRQVVVQQAGHHDGIAAARVVHGTLLAGRRAIARPVANVRLGGRTPDMRMSHQWPVNATPIISTSHDDAGAFAAMAQLPGT